MEEVAPKPKDRANIQQGKHDSPRRNRVFVSWLFRYPRLRPELSRGLLGNHFESRSNLSPSLCLPSNICTVPLLATRVSSYATVDNTSIHQQDESNQRYCRRRLRLSESPTRHAVRFGSGTLLCHYGRNARVGPGRGPNAPANRSCGIGAGGAFSRKRLPGRSKAPGNE